MSDKHKHLELIQGVINRLSTNSFLLKGWGVVLVSGLFALAANGTNPAFVYIAFFPALVFWGLDGYFLWQERLYRALYDTTRVLTDDKIDFSMNTASVAQGVASWVKVCMSKTLAFFHGAIVATIVLVLVISNWG